MNDVIQKLLLVQDLDVEILVLKEKLAEGPRRIAADEEELKGHRDRFEDAARRAKEALRLAERKNSEVDEMDRKINDLSLKQNTSRTNKEYEAFKTEIAGLKADREIFEEEALQQWSVGDEREKESETELLKVTSLEDDLATSRAGWEAELRELESELGELSSTREGRCRGLSPSWLATYDRVLGNRGVPAVVQVVEQYCQGCQMHVTIHDVTRAWKGAEVVQCRSCGRILYAATL